MSDERRIRVKVTRSMQYADARLQSFLDVRFSRKDWRRASVYCILLVTFTTRFEKS